MITNLLNKEEFNKLSLHEKRIAICKDVITRMNVDNISPSMVGRFWDNANDEEYYLENFSLKDRINSYSCVVCAKGALFCSWVGNFNECEWSDDNGLFLDYERSSILKRKAPELVEIFGEEMLDNIEAAFEGDSFVWHTDRITSGKYAYLYGDEDASSRLLRIMNHIIDNGGEFPLP